MNNSGGVREAAPAHLRFEGVGTFKDEFDLTRYPTDVMSVLGAGGEVDAVKLAMARGIRSGNELSDLIFFGRHPERSGQSISSTEPNFTQLSREWLDIHDRVVRPVLTAPPATETALETDSSDTELAHEVWERENERRGPEHVRWVQRSLNLVMGLRLPLDGVAGPATRSAVRSFQARHALPISGTIGADTEHALRTTYSGIGFRSRARRRRSWRPEGAGAGPVHEAMEDEMAQVQPELGGAGATLRVVDRPFVLSQIVAGERDPNKLTNRVFFLRHKDLRGRRIAPGETALKQEWLSILRDIVQPALASVGLRTTRASGPAAVGGGAVAEALRIAKREVPGMPGTTIETLVERWRSSICPEIPRSILFAFIKYESGGKFTDATHGSEKSGWTSPSFYELGLFQTPGGLHGRCTSRDWESCEFKPPGREVPGDRSTWVKLCAAIKADPQQWTNPTTQVRVGLLDLEIGARGLRKDFPELFPKPGSDWDLRMAVLYRFSRGGGYARSFLRLYRRQLAAMPEEQRWRFLRDKTVTASGGAARAFKGENVEEKMALAAKLGYVLT